jgi:hypothetical protein
MRNACEILVPRPLGRKNLCIKSIVYREEYEEVEV